MRKFLAGSLIGFGALVLLASLTGMILAWVYNEPLSLEADTRLENVHTQLSQIQTDLRSAKAEVERALRIIQSAEDALASLTQQTTDAEELLKQVNQTLDDDLIPTLENTRTRITEVRTILKDLRETLNGLNSLPFVNFEVPGDELLSGILAEVNSLDLEIADVQELAQRASVFIADTSYLLGGDFQETKENLQNLLEMLEGYDDQLSSWQQEVQVLRTSLPAWIDNASLVTTLVLFWLGFSQLGLILQGLSIWRGGNPLEVLRRNESE
jgi:DNA repair exonuclease SbcCD ATPase subunit